MIHARYRALSRLQQHLLRRHNHVDRKFYNGIFHRYRHPVLTRDHVPLHWRYELNMLTNPFFEERLGVNSVFNPGAIYHDGKYCLIARIEGTDRKSFFALATSTSGIDRFRFEGLPLLWDKQIVNEVNMYDMRLVKHEDGYIYGTYCSEAKNPQLPNDTEAALARAALVRTRDLVHWEMIGLIGTVANQQRNVVLHPEFIEGKYAFYTRPQDGFVETGNGGGICIGLCDDIMHPAIRSETVLHAKRYHTVYEMKNGQGPAPIKTSQGWIHIAHGVRQTAAGLRYVLYAFATSLGDPYQVIAAPGGYLIAPLCRERIGDVGNVVFCNGVIINEKKEVFIYYASSDTRIHVAKTTVSMLTDYVFNSPEDNYNAADNVRQRIQLIKRNEGLLKRED